MLYEIKGFETRSCFTSFSCSQTLGYSDYCTVIVNNNKKGNCIVNISLLDMLSELRLM